MTRPPLRLTMVAALAAVTLAACAGEAPSGATRDSGPAGGYDRYNDVDRFPQSRGSNPYMKP
jgi:hypothetical protein